MAGVEKTRVAVLGGGVGAMTAALELTHPSQGDRYDVTVYQLGWRLGGKGASGRNQSKGLRIEEHGVHIWFGCYDNSFRLMREVYQELNRPPTAPLATVDDAFKAENYVSLYEQFNGKWTPWTFEFPTNKTPTGSRTELPTLWDYVKHILSWIPSLLARHHAEHFPPAQLAPHFEKPHWWESLLAKHQIALPDLHLKPALGLPHVLAKMGESVGADDSESHAQIASLLKSLKGMIWKVIEPKVETSLELLRMWIMFDLGTTYAIGVIEDDLLRKPISTINRYDFKEWLILHGGSALAVNSPLINALYEMIFGYENGISIGPDAKPSIEAGAIVKAMPYIVLGYSGAFLWKMQAGMGDVIFAPMYEVLKRRGVKFKFFHRVTNLHVENGELASIDISRQVNLTVGEYQPLLIVKGLPCWPSEPLYEQIVEGDQLREQGINLESFYTPWEDTGGEITLRVGEDFDEAVLGIPVGALPFIASELIHASPAWQDMTANVRTVQTQALQVWMQTDAAGLGANIPPGTLFGGLDPAYLDTGADMSQLIEREAWHTAQTKNVTYFAGSLPGPTDPLPADRHDAPQDAWNTVYQNSLDLLDQDIGILWQKAVGSSGFEWKLMVAPHNAPGASRLDSQYVRANIDPSERYVQSVKGSSQYRLPPGDSGFKRLYLAGDWTQSTVNMGSVEGAAVSGMLASQAISGYPQHIVGVTADILPAASPAPPASILAAQSTPALTYVIHGADPAGPAPVVCKDATLWGLVLKGTQSNLEAFLKRVFYDPTQGKVHYYPLGEHVLLTLGNIGKIYSPSADIGWIPEAQTVFWIPALQVRQDGEKLIAERLVIFPAYTYVVEPWSLASGREVFGFFKGWGWTNLPPDLSVPNPPELGLDVFGMQHFDPQKSPERTPFVKITRAGDGVSTDHTPWPSTEAAVRDLIPHLFQNHEQGIVVPGIELGFSLLDDLIHRSMPLVFFKQFRDALNPTGACYQAVQEAQNKTTAFNGLRLIDAYDVGFTSTLATDPIQQDLGLQSQRAVVSFKMQVDFELLPTTVRWSASNGGQPPHP